MPSSRRSKRSTARRRPTVIIGGYAGSGKSTVAGFLARRFRLRQVSAGGVVRAAAKERGMDLVRFGLYLEKHPALDRALDLRLLADAKKGGVVIDGRTTAFLARKHHVPSLKIFLKVDPMVSARRVARRDGITVKEALRFSRTRERGIARRLKAIFGLDTLDASYYDVVVQTDDYTPKEVADLISHLVLWSKSNRA